MLTSVISCQPVAEASFGFSTICCCALANFHLSPRRSGMLPVFQLNVGATVVSCWCLTRADNGGGGCVFSGVCASSPSQESAQVEGFGKLYPSARPSQQEDERCDEYDLPSDVISRKELEKGRLSRDGKDAFLYYAFNEAAELRSSTLPSLPIAQLSFPRAQTSSPVN